MHLVLSNNILLKFKEIVYRICRRMISSWIIVTEFLSKSYLPTAIASKSMKLRVILTWKSIDSYECFGVREFCDSFSSTDLKFCSCSDDTTVKVWDFARCQEERSLAGAESLFTFFLQISLQVLCGFSQILVKLYAFPV